MLSGSTIVTGIVLIFVFGLFTVAVVTVTSFVKISVVLFLLRNALGIQQAPPNIVLYAIALILTGFISAPLGREIYQEVAQNTTTLQTIDDWKNAAEHAEKPLKNHLLHFTQPKERAFFVQATQQLWPEDMRDSAISDTLPVLVPSYLVGELQRAFEIGFLIYLPFITIDLVITIILIAMGMSQVQPSTIAVPLKLLLFVLASGWTRLLHGLVLSYTP